MSIGSLEFDAWRIIGSELNVADSFQQLAPRLFDALSAKAAIVYRIEPERLRVEPAAFAVAEGEKQPTPAAVELPQSVVSSLVGWCREGSVQRAKSREDHPVLRQLLPRSSRGPYLVGPLAKGSNTLGVLVVQGKRAFSPTHVEAMKRVLGPLAAALENDRHVHELIRHREAMEADKQALLARLERQDIADSIVGAETGLREVLSLVEQVAPTDTAVLILGETGSGKEVVARAIHARSPRAKGPMVRANCGAIPSELVDSELFGHERGSFTGATETRKGWFERADGGTLFLDEIGELPPAAQVRLLRVVQDGVVERVGSQRSIRVDVRLVTATHRDLEAMVADGAFRQDLLYRISIFPIRLPPLRERLEDVPSLAAHLALRACKRLGVPPLSLTREDISSLISYSWPGNVRELAAVIERATILGDGKRLAIAQALGSSVRSTVLQRLPSASFATSKPMPSARSDRRDPVTLDSAMSDHIAQALEQAHGRIEGPFGAAKMLGLNPNTLRARMRKLGIDWRQYRT